MRANEAGLQLNLSDLESWGAKKSKASEWEKERMWQWLVTGSESTEVLRESSSVFLVRLCTVHLWASRSAGRRAGQLKGMTDSLDFHLESSRRLFIYLFIFSLWTVQLNTNKHKRKRKNEKSMSHTRVVKKLFAKSQSSCNNQYYLVPHQ